jgi:radical SAM superfamily enzyme YgiQ (UPF0313 family)
VASIVLINPKFEVSFWGLEHAMPLIGKRANMPVAALPLLAALTPACHRVTIVDENVEPIDFDRLAHADIVGVTGMIVQRRRLRELLTELKRRGLFTVVGGPWVSVNESWFETLADVVFIGEAEQTWPQFLSDWERGKHARRYEQSEKTDMTSVPPPRLDLIKTNRYAFGSVQFSRGCPFTCEFCDIIVIFGRRPRLKTGRQIVAELEGLLAHGMTEVFIVDDNLIGNRKAIKEVLRHVIEWQKAHNYPIMFATEASIDVADDDEVMQLMVEANICVLFVGIESPNEESLKEAKKLQNLRRGGTMIEKLRRIQERGMEVWAGMIVGFDNDDTRVFAAQRRFVTDARVPTAMIGMLSAIPRTPLYDRMKNAGRLDDSDSPAYGTNVLPANMSRDELSNGFVQLMAELYDPVAYFDRLDDLYRHARICIDRAWQDHVRTRPWLRWKRDAYCWLLTFVLLARLAMLIPERQMWRIYRRRFWAFLRDRPEPQVARVYALKCAIHWHMHKFAQQLSDRTLPLVNTY